MSYEKTLVLNDQGEAVINITKDVTNTLRAQDHGHPPVVLIYDARGNGGGQNVSNDNGRSPSTHIGLHGDCRCYTLSSFGRYVEGTGTLRANGGDIGGGQ